MSKSNLVKYGQTINLNLGCLGMGLMTSVIGATLLDLTEVYDSRVELASHVITARGIGALMGSLFGGMLLDKFNTQILITTAMLIASITILLVPVCPTLPVAYVVTLIYGLTVGIFDTGANIWIINLWGKNNGPMLQIYHFAFGLGGLVSPLVAEPFLSVHHAEDPEMMDFPSPSPIGVPDSPSWNETEVVEAVLSRSRIDIPYAMIACIHFLLFVSMCVMYRIDPSDSKPPPELLGNEVTASKPKRYTLLMCLSFYLLVYVALESSLGQMLATFAVKSKLHFTKSQASYLSSLFWTFFTMSRVLSALWAMVSTPKSMMLVEHAMTIVALGTFLWFGETNATMVWICAAMVGVGAAGMFATAITWTVEFMPLSNKMMSISTVFSGSGGTAPPFIVGKFIDKCPMSLIYACSSLAVILTFFMCIMWKITSTMTPRKSMLMDSTELKEAANGPCEKGDDASIAAV
ncbi:sodium-dependent glucose transporter 1A [Galendromus occidentalis]|uniref:Major facilitator superfamily domain-containing protein 4A n=1 Tax=Galendromus occidentalis TaxID=34638 RepID=A0AAJ6VX28_9ACAR|nr:sodium-dependent glucose transporter 1A [Galendromus occidentalis]